METKPKVLKWALIIGIVIVLNLFFNYSISLFYKEPDYATYFPQTQVVQQITNKDDCLKIGGQWNENNYTYTGVGNGNPNTAVKGYCDPSFTKQQNFSNAQNAYQRNIFIILVILGVLVLIIGAFIPNEIITLSFSWGGVLSLLIASVRYWSVAENFIKVLILAAALGALIWLAIKKFSN